MRNCSEKPFFIYFLISPNIKIRQRLSSYIILCGQALATGHYPSPHGHLLPPGMATSQAAMQALQYQLAAAASLGKCGQQTCLCQHLKICQDYICVFIYSLCHCEVQCLLTLIVFLTSSPDGQIILLFNFFINYKLDIVNLKNTI